MLPPLITATLLAASPVGANPFAGLADDFVGVDGELATDRGWLAYKPAAIATAEVQGNELVLEAVRGGGGDYQGGLAEPTASFWYTQSNTDQRDGLALYKAVGPASGTPVAFDARVRLAVTDGTGTGLPPAVVGEWRFAGLAIHHPDRSTYLRYLHVALGTEGGTGITGIEVKVNRVNDDGGQSVYPVVAIDTTGLTELAYDLRLVRRASNTDIFDIHTRPVSSGQPLASNVGWTLQATVRWSDGEDEADTFPACPVERDDVLPDDVHIALVNYSSAFDVDLRARAGGFVVLPSAA